jgi:ATP-dependent DNA ligase
VASTTPDCQAPRRHRRRPTAREVRLVYYAFDLLHLADSDVSKLPLIERKALLKALLKRLVANKPGLQFNGHATSLKAETIGAANDVRHWALAGNEI